MAFTVAEEARVNAIEVWQSQVQANTKSPSELTGEERKLLEDAIYPIINGFRAWKDPSNNDYENWEIGDEVVDISDANKRMVIGKVIAVPFDPSSELDDKSKLDMYQDNKPKL